ncbi:hypothetical protein SAMN04488095_0994 [Jannaschia pohangensis]|uniref:Anti-sigma factor NepR domain-containing protein n=2 Tax=Jannaschia pohangensis TaxID=390807 RepID=A0A1I3IJ03_9RHOB|nr:hypothetical protein SAMN04488095_0994 [Jannaschia pohangensis]
MKNRSKDEPEEDDMDGPAPHVVAMIDQNLKLVYSDLVREELPDRFKDLLAVLKAQDADKGASS